MRCPCQAGDIIVLAILAGTPSSLTWSAGSPSSSPGRSPGRWPVAMDVSNHLADGDLIVAIEVTAKDETGQLLAAMKNMVEQDQGDRGRGEIGGGQRRVGEPAAERDGGADVAGGDGAGGGGGRGLLVDGGDVVEHQAERGQRPADGEDGPEGGDGRQRRREGGDGNREGDEGDRGEDHDHRGDRPADEPAGPECGDRGGAGRRAREGVRRGGLRGAEARRAEPDGGRRRSASCRRAASRWRRGPGRC